MSEKCESNDALVNALQNARDGDGTAIGEVLEGFRGYLTLLARIQIGRRLQSKVDPDDVVQETFFDAHRQWSAFRGESIEAVAAWLRTILAGQLAQLIRRYCVTEARNIRLEISIEQDLDSSSARLAQGLAGPGSSPSESVGRREELTILANMLERLPADYRTVILLRQIDGLSFGEISSRLGRSEDSIQKLWVRGLQALRVLMNQPLE